MIDGKVVRKNAPQGPSVTLGDVARALNPGSKLLGDAIPGLAADGFFESAHMNYPYGIHFAVVRIDRDTGGVAIERYFVAYDIGKAVNPMLVDGQIAGGVAQGVGGALLEEFLYDARGEPLCVNFADYLMPTAREIPPIEMLITEDAPSPLNSLGVKGAGEGGANAVGAAIAAAIDDALGRPGAVTQLPVTPQRLRKMLRTRGLERRFRQIRNRSHDGAGGSKIRNPLGHHLVLQSCTLSAEIGKLPDFLRRPLTLTRKYIIFQYDTLATSPRRGRSKALIVITESKKCSFSAICR